MESSKGHRDGFGDDSVPEERDGQDDDGDYDAADSDGGHSERTDRHKLPTGLRRKQLARGGESFEVRVNYKGAKVSQHVDTCSLTRPGAPCR